MKNPLKAINKAAVKQLPKLAGNYILAHQGAFLTGGTIACNAAGIAVTYRNSPEIHRIISEAKAALSNLNPGEDELKKQIVKGAVIEAGKLIVPILLFFAASTTCTIVNHKKNEAKIAALTAALSLAQGTIAEYDSFKEEVKNELGEERFNEIHREAQKQAVQQEVSAMEVKPNPGERLFYIRYLGCYFSAPSKDKVEAVMREACRIIRDNDLKNNYGTFGRDGDGNNVVVMSMADICRELGVKEEDIPDVAYDIRFRSDLNAPSEAEPNWVVGTIERNGEPMYALIIEPDISKLKDFF